MSHNTTQVHCGVTRRVLQQPNPFLAHATFAALKEEEKGTDLFTWRLMLHERDLWVMP
jgi:hypothetical protein